jgi:hypothetical protein
LHTSRLKPQNTIWGAGRSCGAPSSASMMLCRMHRYEKARGLSLTWMLRVIWPWGSKRRCVTPLQWRRGNVNLTRNARSLSGSAPGEIAEVVMLARAGAFSIESFAVSGWRGGRSAAIYGFSMLGRWRVGRAAVISAAILAFCGQARREVCLEKGGKVRRKEHREVIFE